MKACRKNILKRAGIAMLCTGILLSAALPVNVFARTEADGAEEPGKKELAYIQIGVGDGQETPVFQAGEQAKLQINVKNSGNADAQNVRITPVIQNESDWPFEIGKLNYEQNLGTLAAGKQLTALWGTDDDLLTVREDVTGKAYKLVFRITYDDGERIYETEKHVFAKTVAKEKPSTGQPSEPETPSAPGNAGTPDPGPGAGEVYNSDPVVVGGGSAEEGSGSVPRVIVTGFTTQPGEVKAGSDFKLIVHLKNTSSKTAVSNMLFDLQAPSSGTEAAAEAPAFLPSSGSSSIYLESIPAGGTSDISIDLNARADLVQKPYSISMSMKYEDSRATQYEAQSSLAIPVVQKARFEFSKIQVAPDTVSVGEEVNISCSLYNLGRVKMYNIKARFEGKMIESQEQFIGNLDAGATGTIDSIVTAKKAAKTSEKCKLILSYEDDAGNISTAEQTFSMTVTEEVSMDMGMVPADMPEERGLPTGIIVAVIAVAAGAAGIVIFIRRKKKKIREAEEEELFDEVERFTEDEH